MIRFILVLSLFIFTSCSEDNYESRELPTKYPDTPTSGAAYDVTEELYENKP